MTIEFPLVQVSSGDASDADGSVHVPRLTTIQPPNPIAIEQDFLGAENATAFAQEHASAADAYIAKLGELAAALVPPVINPQFPTNTNAPAISTPVAPDVLPITYNPPPVPAQFTGSLSITQAFPLFTAQPPQLLFPNAPISPNDPLPSQPGVDLNFTYPTVAVKLPDAPNLMSISVQPFGGVTLPTLDATAPTLTALAPSVVNYVPNAPYTDALLQELTLTLKQRLDIGNTGTNTGLPPGVEENIWNRAREREYRAQRDALAALDRMEEMGYAFPPGTFIDAQIKIQTDTDATITGLSRDIAIKQAELEQANIKQALDATVAIESRLIDYANQTEQRRFEACKYATEAGISIYNAQVEAFKAIVENYRARIAIYQAQMDGAKLTVEVYQAQLEAEKTKVDANNALVNQYKVMVDAALASIEVFKGEIQIIQTQAEIEKLKVDIYGAEVNAYNAKVNVFTSQIEAYKAQIQAEETKQQAYSTQAQAYSTQVEAISKEIDAQIAVFKAQLDAKIQEYEAYKAQVEGQAENVKALAAANAAVADIYRAEVQGTSAYNDAMVKEWQATIEVAERVTQIGVQAAQAQGQLYLTTQSIATDAAKVGAQVEAQIAASALGSVTYATHRARQDSVSYGNNQSVNYSAQRSQNTNVSTIDQTGDNTNHNYNESQNTSVSSSTSTVHQINSVE